VTAKPKKYATVSRAKKDFLTVAKIYSICLDRKLFALARSWVLSRRSDEKLEDDLQPSLKFVGIFLKNFFIWYRSTAQIADVLINRDCTAAIAGRRKRRAAIAPDVQAISYAGDVFLGR
jgi:hypothetical protein